MIVFITECLNKGSRDSVKEQKECIMKLTKSVLVGGEKRKPI
jgi:hypothetical protein